MVFSHLISQETEKSCPFHFLLFFIYLFNPNILSNLRAPCEMTHLCSEIFGDVLLKCKKWFCICGLLLMLHSYSAKNQWVLGKRTGSTGTAQVLFLAGKRNASPVSLVIWSFSCYNVQLKLPRGIRFIAKPTSMFRYRGFFLSFFLHFLG